MATGGPRISQVTETVHMVSGTNVNWALVTEGEAVTLIDAGYPGDRDGVEESVRAIGRRPENIVAVLLTHAHLDHMGGIPNLVDHYGAPVYTGAVEARHARREFLEQISAKEMTALLRTQRGRKWVTETLRAVGPHVRMSVPSAAPFPKEGPLDVPGRPVPVPTPGHTSGHTAYFLPSAGIVFSGDALVTGHPLVPDEGPQLLPGFFNTDETRTEQALQALAALDADVLVPGHGPVLRMPIQKAVDKALDRRR